MRVQPETMFVVQYELSPREMEVLEMVAKGDATKTIARRLAISPKTVNVHRSKILLKMHARNMIEAVAIALTNQHILPRPKTSPTAPSQES